RIERAERDQRMIDRIAGEDDDRFFRREPAVEQPGGDMPDGVEQFRVSELAPGAAGGALRHKDVVRRRLGPMMQPIRQAERIAAERRLRAKIDGAVASAFDRHGGIAEGNTSQGMRACGARGVACRAHAGFTLAVLRSRKARMRRLASLSLCATVAISDSINSPVCGLASAIIGSACNTAKFVSGALAAMRSASSSALGSAPPASVRYCANP